MKFHVWCDGDHTVGDYGNSATVEFNVASEVELVTFAKEQLARCFKDIWDSARVSVMTDEEMARYEAAESEEA